MAAIIVVATAFLFPFFWMVSNAIRTNDEVLAVPPRLLPSQAHWENFVQAWLYLPFGRFFLNSAIVAAAVTLIVLVVSSMAGYAFARLRFPFRGSLFAIYMGTLMVPQAVLVIPLFLMMSRIGWVNTYQGLILPMAFGSFGTFLLRQFFLQVPRELEEAALIDGASRVRILVSIMLPLAGPALGLLALFTFTAQWNNFLWALIITNGNDHATLPLGLTLFQGQQGSQWNFLMAGTTISVLPGLVLTILLQRYIFRGLSLTSGFGGK
ncbi:carbohydrate ABC transporter membrane protein 2, CUT1 family [Faunimonas pinastri]|uniref:Carbohydrate ABC transporter membrane protein 2, CUT1 family n=1 Tax=Faunimonas pinastri TaxID=1855383 RepID=A0A1H9QT84_9HYPH|nr:carbohydrate ABC transporter permease [Faunimonas pinastri]SER63455.1 carbohydrate ABC transporter membrane protein 2, CUT1 family [Faunimonas pinastri]